ncbi:flippase-like domain-containing protein [Candidatus Uabimicrobium sp. HlEnr_7]|uniref:flippase-like domain-containing protein n=1 Tax=Candidatus Uabimicrobium helgolandensis TaxID=3095367 RepID=UPI003556CE83
MKILKNMLLVLGIVVIIGLVYQIGARNIWQEIRQLGVYAPLFLLPYFGVYLLDTLGWKYSFSRSISVPFSTLFYARVAGEAINHVTPTAYLGGEPVKAYILNKKNNVPLAHGFASVMVAKFLMVASEVIFILIGIEIAMNVLGDRSNPVIVNIQLSIATLAIFLLVFLALQVYGFGNFFSKWAAKMKILASSLTKYKEALTKFDSVLLDYYRNEKGRLITSFFYYFLSWCCGVFEVYAFFALTGQTVSWSTIFAIEAIAMTIKGAGFFIPGSIGVQEAGQVMLFKMFGFDSSVGLAFSILRRSREVLWIVIGLFLLGRNWEKKYC